MTKYIIMGLRKRTGEPELRIVSSVEAYRAETASMENFLAYPWERLKQAEQSLRAMPWATEKQKEKLLRKLRAISRLA